MATARYDKIEAAKAKQSALEEPSTTQDDNQLDNAKDTDTEMSVEPENSKSEDNTNEDMENEDSTINEKMKEDNAGLENTEEVK